MLNLRMRLETDLESLEKFAADFWAHTGNTKVFAFHGGMGAGKTTSIAAICLSKGITDPVSSPTFSIINEYRIPGATELPDRIFHIDLYRLDDTEEIIQAGVQDCVDSGNYCFVEWPEKASWLFEEDCLHVVIRPGEEGRREINILGPEEWTGNSIS
jgi:tRNA threonylcarbamoyladenosine biosynthesis protein TsaE